MSPGTYESDSVEPEVDDDFESEPIGSPCEASREIASNLYEAAKEFVERYTSGRRHIALKESLPRLRTALEDAEELFEE